MRRAIRSLGPFLLLLFVAAFVQTVIPSDLHAQEMEDVVYLKDGSILRGTIIEDIPGESLRIQTRDGNVFRISYDRIDRRVREAAVVPANQPTPQPQIQPRMQVATGRKNPTTAFLISFFIVGGGQGYNGQWGKAVLMFGGAVASAAVAQAGSEQEECMALENPDCGQRNLGYAGMGLFWIWSWLDAPMTASAINRRLDAGVSLEIGPRPQLGFPSDRLASQLAGRRVAPQFGVSVARVRF